MHASPISFSSYYLPTSQQLDLPTYNPLKSRIYQDFPGSPMPNSTQPTASIPIDPSLAPYPPYYLYPQHQLSLPTNYPSSSSQGSDGLGTPPTELRCSGSSSNANGKRPSSSTLKGNGSSSGKKPREEEEEETSSSLAEKEEPKAKPTRGSRACTVCRRLKMKCVGAEQGPPCKRCQNGNHECVFEESNRGKRSTKKHEYLTRSLRKMEQTLDTVLRSIGNPGIDSGIVSRSPSPSVRATTRALLASPSPPPSAPFQHTPGSPKLHCLPDNSLNPLGLLAEASLASYKTQGIAQTFLSVMTSSDTKVGVASEIYFKPGPLTILPLRRLYIERQAQPEMLNFVSTEEVAALFNIYFENMNVQCGLLDRDLHTPSLVCSRSPFLLTTICAISSKFYTARSDLHGRLTELVKKLTFTVPAQGHKSVEIVQAYLLLSLWGSDAVERYEQDKTWLLLGMAIRMATDLNLYRKATVTSQDTQEGRARGKEVHSWERTWILCYIIDRSFSAQMGKPHSVNEDYIIRNAAQWCRSPFAIASDASLAAYLEYQRICSRSLDFLYSGTNTASGLLVGCDYLLVIKSIESQLFSWQHEWDTNLRNAEPGPAGVFRQSIFQFYLNYALLVFNSIGLQNALECSRVDVAHFFARCHSAATTCVTLVRDELGPGGFLKYSPDSHFVKLSYAVLNLLKFRRPELKMYYDTEQEDMGLVKDIADVLEHVSVNQLHTPALYSSFLRNLISAKADASDSRNSDEPASPTLVDSAETPTATGDMPPANSFGLMMIGNESVFDEFQFNSEMGPVAATPTFPPTMASSPCGDELGMMSMDSILHSAF